MTNCIAFGPNESWVVCSDDLGVTWGSGLPTLIHNKLNGRNNNSQCAPTQVAAMGRGGKYALFFDDHNWWVNHDSVVGVLNNDDIKGCDVKSCSFGDDDSYLLLLESGECYWRNVHPRLEQLIQTKNNASTTWATIGEIKVILIAFDDGAFYWGGDIHDDLSQTLQNNNRIEKVWLSPFNKNYFVEFSDRSTEWIASESFSNIQLSDGRENSIHVLYTNASISQEFTCGRSIHDVAKGLRNGTIDADDIPCMHVFDWNGTTYSLNNRRLWVMSNANIKSMPVKHVTPPHSITSKLENDFDGTNIRLR